MGGTEILEPLKYVNKKFASKEGLKQRVFILTDGSVWSPEAVVDFAGKHSEITRIFTFGLGSGCDRNLVEKTASKGRGTHTIVEDNAQNLNGLVIKALFHAMDPSIKAA